MSENVPSAAEFNGSVTDEIWAISREIIMCKKDLLGSFIRLGNLLRAANEGMRYKSFASHIKTFNDFLTEMDIKKSTAYNAMAVAERFGEEVIRRGLTIDPTRLVRMLPLKMDPDKQEEFLTKAASLPAEAFQNSIKEFKGEITTDECKHDGETELYTRCCTCGKFFKES